jgi:hypothetical protein
MRSSNPQTCCVPPPMTRQNIRGFAIARSCHFHRPSSSAIRAVLALFWKSTATPCSALRFGDCVGVGRNCAFLRCETCQTLAVTRVLHSRTAKTTTSGQFRQCDRARRTVYIIRQSIIRHGLSARYRLEVHLLWTRAMSITTERRSMGGLRIAQFFPAVRPKDSRCSLVFDAIRALQDSFSALAWTRISKHVTIIHRCHPTTDSSPVLHAVALQREQASRNSAFQHFPGAGRAFGR